MIPPIEIESARPQDLDSIQALLGEHGLPIDGMLDQIPTTVVARTAGRVVGSAGLELYPDGALLRSIVVAPQMQRQGVGHRLIEAAIAIAITRRVPAIYLLTITTEEYFAKFGFTRVDRAAVPDMVKGSAEFKGARSSSAAVMRKTLQRDPRREPRLVFLQGSRTIELFWTEALAAFRQQVEAESTKQH